MTNRRRSMLTLALSVCCAIAFSSIFVFAAADEKGPESLEGKAAPDFSLQTLDGKTLKLSDQKGSVVLIDMWATWCPPCRASLPHVQKMAQDQQLASKGLKVWAVNDKEQQAIVKKFLADNKYTFTVPMDTKGEVLEKYLVSGIPTTVIVGRDGNVAKTFVGYGGEESAKEIDKAVEDALAKAGPAT